MIYLAYDGSLNGDWVAQYALNTAAHHASKNLHLLHILDGKINSAELSEKINRLEKQAKRHKVKIHTRVEPLKQSVFASLEGLLTAEDKINKSFLFCGARARGRKGYLAGTISEKLLHSGLCNVIALRVVQPGQLGSPSNVLIPVSDKLKNVDLGLSFLQLFSEFVEKVHVVHIARLNSFRYRHLAPEKATQMKMSARNYVHQVLELVRAQFKNNFHLDHRVLISDSVSKEILIQAGKLKSNLVLMGATSPGLLHRFFYGDSTEEILRQTPCDVAVCRSAPLN